jgi:hypothetical protein
VKNAAMPICPIHHGSNADSTAFCFFGNYLIVVGFVHAWCWFFVIYLELNRVKKGISWAAVHQPITQKKEKSCPPSPSAGTHGSPRSASKSKAVVVARQPQFSASIGSAEFIESLSLFLF